MLLEAHPERREPQLRVAHEREQLVEVGQLLAEGGDLGQAPAGVGDGQGPGAVPGAARGHRRDCSGRQAGLDGWPTIRALIMLGTLTVRVIGSGRLRTPPRCGARLAGRYPAGGPPPSPGSVIEAGSSSSSRRSAAMPALGRQLADRAPALERLLGQRRRGVVADLGRQRRRQHQPLLDQRRPAVGRLRGPRPAGPRKLRAEAASSVIDSSSATAVTGSITLSSSSEPVWPKRDRRVVADDPGDDHRQALDDHRVHLAGHDRRARLRLGQGDLGEPGARAHAHQPDVGARSSTGRGRSSAARRGPRSTASSVAWAWKWFGVSRTARPVSSRQPAAGPRRELRVGVDPGPDRGAAERHRQQLVAGGLRRGGSPPRPGPRSPRTPGRGGSASRPGGASGRS